MKQVYEDFLFSQGYFVSHPAPDEDMADTYPAHALVALAHYGEIYITKRPDLANLHMLEVAARNLGKDVPEPFMRGFPETARELSPSLRLLDQFIHYFKTYGLDDFSAPGHSLFERYYQRAAFSENVTPKEFAILTFEEALALLKRAADGFLASTRPLNDTSYELLISYLVDYGRIPTRCACKDTACRLILDLRDERFAELLALSDVIRLVEWLLELNYPDMVITKLSLKNKDRVFIQALLDRIFAQGNVNLDACLEKRKIWNGLLHHIHYQPQCGKALSFCLAMRNKEPRSIYSRVEELVRDRDVSDAARILGEMKGPAAVARNLAYFISRCTSAEERDRIVELLGSCNKIVLIQLLFSLFLYDSSVPRVFTFVQLNRMKKHIETPREMYRRGSLLGEETRLQLLIEVEDLLKRSCHATLGTVYADKALRRIALPLQESAAMGGYGTLPRGSRLHIPQGKIVRAFVYWEKVNDIDLSCIALSNGSITREYSWRVGEYLYSTKGMLFSGDQTSGFHGGSEYFDIDLDVYHQTFPDDEFLVFCANVYSDSYFSQCVCRAGYMLRDTVASGEVFEPKTVQTSFTITCASTEAYLFVVDIKHRDLIWLNIGMEGSHHVAGEVDVSFLSKYLHSTDVINLHSFAQMLATEVVDTPDEADVVFSDDEIALREDQELIKSTDTARILELLNS